MTDILEKAYFAAGCFWGVEAAFRETAGVKQTAVGYMGGNTDNPTYKDVCSGTTNHAEVVMVAFHPQEISYEELLKVFWKSHDPTQVNRQGPDVGTQYRTAIFTVDDAQAQTAKASKEAENASGKHQAPIATEITPAGTFYLAEEYHQQYLEKRGLASCHLPG